MKDTPGKILPSLENIFNFNPDLAWEETKFWK